VQRYVWLADGQPQLSHDNKLELLRQKVKYVFVIYQENRSFDFHFGTFPGADGLFSKSAAATAGFTQQIVSVSGQALDLRSLEFPHSAKTVKDAGGNADASYPRMPTQSIITMPGISSSLDFDMTIVAHNDRHALNGEG
jgi:phospholipase C